MGVHSYEFSDESDEQSCQEGDDANMAVPFYAWECISISLKSGVDFSLIVRDEHQMKQLTQFLILKLKAFNGVRDTFEAARKAL